MHLVCFPLLSSSSGFFILLLLSPSLCAYVYIASINNNKSSLPPHTLFLSYFLSLSPLLPSAQLQLPAQLQIQLPFSLSLSLSSSFQQQQPNINTANTANTSTSLDTNHKYVFNPYWISPPPPLLNAHAVLSFIPDTFPHLGLSHSHTHTHSTTTTATTTTTTNPASFAFNLE
ncbi:hypothetical protein F5H01DRAFT_356304 [Linnemannia elongata]|nr:hypothetical protein F5H01DRAFT_356304 [Linnemannia elongata]